MRLHYHVLFVVRCIAPNAAVLLSTCARAAIDERFKRCRRELQNKVKSKRGNVPQSCIRLHTPLFMGLLATAVTALDVCHPVHDSFRKSFKGSFPGVDGSVRATVVEPRARCLT